MAYDCDNPWEMVHYDMARKRKSAALAIPQGPSYETLLAGITTLLADARRATVRAANSILTATYYEVGHRIVEFEQGGKARAEYGEELWHRLAADLTTRFGRGFSKSNLASMRSFYLQWEIFQTLSGKLEARVRGQIIFVDKADGGDSATSVIAGSVAMTALAPDANQENFYFACYGMRKLAGLDQF